MKNKTDRELKAELIKLAKSGAPMPKPNSELGRALKRFTAEDEALEPFVYVLRDILPTAKMVVEFAKKCKRVKPNGSGAAGIARDLNAVLDSVDALARNHVIFTKKINKKG